MLWTCEKYLPQSRYTLTLNEPTLVLKVAWVQGSRPRVQVPTLVFEDACASARPPSCAPQQSPLHRKGAGHNPQRTCHLLGDLRFMRGSEGSGNSSMFSPVL